MNEIKKQKRRIIATWIFLGLFVPLAIFALLFTAVAADDFFTMLKTKKITSSQGDIFYNQNTKHQNIQISKPVYTDYKYMYMYNNIQIVSYSDQWDEDGLIAIGDELYANQHGDEIDYLYSILLYDEGSDMWGGMNDWQQETLDVPVSLYGFLPDSMTLELATELSRISLYDMDTLTQIKDIAQILSHEYGHHYCWYHIEDPNDGEIVNSEYYSLRAHDENIRSTHDSDLDYAENHKWYIHEIAAEDYMYLMGSETTKRHAEVYDSKELADIYARQGEKAFYEASYQYLNARNSTPHENVEVPMPHEVDGLVEYFYSFVDAEPPTYTDIAPLGDLSLSLTRISQDQYRFTWDKPYDDPDIVYTLIAYDEKGVMYDALKTINGDEKARADIGVFTKEHRGYLYTVNAIVDRETKFNFRVSVTLPDNTVELSDAVELVY